METVYRAKISPRTLTMTRLLSPLRCAHISVVVSWNTPAQIKTASTPHSLKFNEWVALFHSSFCWHFSWSSLWAFSSSYPASPRKLLKTSRTCQISSIRLGIRSLKTTRRKFILVSVILSLGIAKSGHILIECTWSATIASSTHGKSPKISLTMPSKKLTGKNWLSLLTSITKS